MKTIALMLSITMATYGCAGATYRPMVDQKSSPQNYEQDVRECQSYAATQAGAADAAVAGAIFGAILGLAVGAVAGSHRQTNTWGGAISGAAGGAAGAERNQTDIIKKCMEGRGYSVLR